MRFYMYSKMRWVHRAQCVAKDMGIDRILAVMRVESSRGVVENHLWHLFLERFWDEFL